MLIKVVEKTMKGFTWSVASSAFCTPSVAMQVFWFPQEGRQFGALGSRV